MFIRLREDKGPDDSGQLIINTDHIVEMITHLQTIHVGQSKKPIRLDRPQWKALLEMLEVRDLYYLGH